MAVVDKKGLRAGDRAALVDAASGTCHNPACAEPLIVWRDGQPIINFEVAHVRDELPPSDPNADVGWRYWPADDLTQDERNTFRNLLLLCSPCHKLIDRVDPRSYSVELLHQWKMSAESGSRAFVLDRSLGVLGPTQLVDLVVAALAGPKPLDLRWPGVGVDDDLLNFASRDTAHIGMDGELGGLRQFLRDPAPFYWWMILGDAGVGKSRLALELCVEASTEWHGGFLTEAAQDELIGYDPADPTLVVVDYAAARAEWLGKALYDHSTRAETHRAPLRVLILERSATESWLSDALRVKRHNESQALLARQYATPLGIVGLGDDDLRSLINDVAGTRGRSLSLTEVEYVLDRILEVDPLRRPLFAIVATLDALGDDEHAQTRDSLLRAILRRRSARRSEDLPDPLLRVLTDGLELVATAVGGVEVDRYHELRTISQASGPLHLPSTAELSAHRMGPSLRGIQPDILGELAVLDALQDPEEASRQLASDGLRLAWRFDQLQYAAFTERVARDHPWHSALGDLLNVDPGSEAERDTWFALAPRVVPYLGSSANPSLERIASLLEMQENEAEERSQRAMNVMMFHVGNLLLNEGRIQDAIDLYTAAIETADPAWESYASSLTNRGVAYLQLDRVDDAEGDFSSVIDSTRASDEAKACCLNNRADLRSGAGDPARSVADRTAVLQLTDTTYNRRYIALVRRAHSLWEMGDSEAAFADLQAVLEEPDIVIEQKLNARLD
ncbi:MAG: hypothetical protein LC808_31415, partial [Actinobacteria bacterium]|nr:hypothetical protein [Actinomycetota bacterium]